MMIVKNLYDNDYIVYLKKHIYIFRFIISFLILGNIAFAAISIFYSSMGKYYGLLMLNIPINIIGLFITMIVAQVYLPTYKWELKMVDRAEKSRKYNVEGLILNINKKTVYYEDQKFVPIVIQNNQQEIELFIRPWLLKSNITEGSSVSLDYVSKVIVSIGVGDKL